MNVASELFIELFLFLSGNAHNFKRFFIVGTNTFFSGKSKCQDLNGTFARVETALDLMSASLVMSEENVRQVWIALRKSTYFIQVILPSCFSSFDDFSVKKKLKWTDGNAIEVNALPWGYESWRKGNWTFSTCSAKCIYLLRKDINLRLQDGSCGLANNVICYRNNSIGKYYIRNCKFSLLSNDRWVKKSVVDVCFVLWYNNKITN